MFGAVFAIHKLTIALDCWINGELANIQQTIYQGSHHPIKQMNKPFQSKC